MNISAGINEIIKKLTGKLNHQSLNESNHIARRNYARKKVE